MCQVRRQWGDPKTTAEMITKFSLEWLGHLFCMPKHKIGLVWMDYQALSKVEKVERCFQEGPKGD